jgi:VWFA-related protein
MNTLRLLVVCSLVACGHLAAAADSQFAERITVTEVEIPVRVLIDGQPVRGLAAEHFELFDRGVRQQILSCEERDLSLRVSPPEGPPADYRPDPESSDGRKLLVVFDSRFSRRHYLVRALRGVRAMVDFQIHPTDRVAIAVYNGASGLNLVEGFTVDRERITLALDIVDAILSSDRKGLQGAHAALLQLTDRQLQDEDADPRLRHFDRMVAAVGPTAAVALQGTTKGAAGLDAGLEAVSIFGVGQRGGFGLPGAIAALDPTLAQLVRNSPEEFSEEMAVSSVISDVRALALTLGDTVTLLRELGGQKQMVLLSEGFAGGLLADSAVLYHLQNMLKAFRRTGWTLNAVDVEGIPEIGRPAFDADSLLFMAKETGGELFENYNNLAAATERLLERTSVTYVLTFQPTDLVLDGSFHKVEVELKQGPAKARLSHRPGYQAPSPLSAKGQIERRVDAAEMILTNEEIAEMEVSVLAAPIPGSSGRWFVPVVVEIPGDNLVPTDENRRRRKTLVEVHVYAVDSKGAVLDLMVNGVELDMRKVASTLEKGGLRIVGRLELEEGEYRIRVLVRYQENGGLFLSTIPVSMGVKDGGAPTFLAPLFFSLADGWLVVRDAASLAVGSAEALPFHIGGLSFVPAVRPTLGRDEAIGVFLLGSDLSQPDLIIASRVLTAAGEVASGGALDLMERLVDDPDGLDRVVGTFRPSGLTAGEYRLEITAALESGEILASTTSSFVVQN